MHHNAFECKSNAHSQKQHVYIAKTTHIPRFKKDLTDQCYIPPLKLEPSKEGVFLETEFEIQKNHIVHRLKNDNKDPFDPQIWRYQHFNSFAPYVRKRAVIMAAFNKVQFHASNRDQCIQSGILKAKEFMIAGYPDSVIKFCTNKMANGFT